MPPELIQMLIQQLQHQGQGGANFANSLLTNPGRPYGNAEREYDFHAGPWSQMGRNAGNAFNTRLGEMGNGENFYNNTMAGYNESPYARIQQQQGVRAGNAMGSASGLSGSTPLANFMQQNAQNISSQDMQNYFNQRMGINNQYLQGQNQLMNYGYGSDMQSAPFHAEMAYNKQSANDANRSNQIQSLLQMLGLA